MATDIYTTRSGDTWDLVSYRVYGTGAYMDDLLAANPAQRHVAVFGGNVELVCPDIALPSASTLPPWKRGAA